MNDGGTVEKKQADDRAIAVDERERRSHSGSPSGPPPAQASRPHGTIILRGVFDTLRGGRRPRRGPVTDPAPWEVP